MGGATTLACLPGICINVLRCCASGLARAALTGFVMGLESRDGATDIHPPCRSLRTGLTLPEIQTYIPGFAERRVGSQRVSRRPG